MSTLHTLLKLKYKKKKRLGRGTGSGMGEKSTRGTKRHQAAKEQIPIFFEGGQNPLTKKFPLLRGKLRNRSFIRPPIVLNLFSLTGFKKNEEVTIESLISKKIVDKSARRNGVKLLGRGTINQALTIKIPLSKSARDKIIKQGGVV